MRMLRLSALAIFVFTATLHAASPGDVVINEVMQNPGAVSDAAGEWFELYNATGVPIALDGWRIDVYWGPWRRYGPERFGRPIRQRSSARRCAPTC